MIKKVLIKGMSCGKCVNDEDIKFVIDDAGYEVVGIETI